MLEWAYPPLKLKQKGIKYRNIASAVIWEAVNMTVAALYSDSIAEISENSCNFLNQNRNIAFRL